MGLRSVTLAARNMRKPGLVKRGMSPLIRISIAAAFASLAAIGAAADGWLTSYPEAVKQSKKSGKPILANFTGSDWCHWCEVLHKEVFAKKEFKTWAKKNVVLLELDYPRGKKLPKARAEQNANLAKIYQISGYPTILFLKSDGTKIGRSGYIEGGPSRWIQHATETLKAKKG